MLMPSYYTFNGLNWRVTRDLDTSKSAYDGVDEGRDYFYSAGWQMVEERVDTDLDGTTDHVSQQVWGQRYIDDAVARRITEDSVSRRYIFLTERPFNNRRPLHYPTC